METPDKFASIISYETTRYKHKGFGLIVSLLITFGFFYFAPIIGNLIYPKNINSEGEFFFNKVLLVHEASFILFNLIMFIIYKLKHPFFERYKTTSSQWPWEQNYSDWKALIIKTLKLLLLNHLIVLPGFMYLFVYFDFCPLNTKYEELPTSPFTYLFHFLFYIIVE